MPSLVLPTVLTFASLSVPQGDLSLPSSTAIDRLQSRITESSDGGESVRVALAVDIPMHDDAAARVQSLLEHAVANDAIDVDPRAAQFKVTADCVRTEGGYDVVLRLKDEANRPVETFVTRIDDATVAEASIAAPPRCRWIPVGVVPVR
jgi:hypothetical protein